MSQIDRNAAKCQENVKCERFFEKLIRFGFCFEKSKSQSYIVSYTELRLLTRVVQVTYL